MPEGHDTDFTYAELVRRNNDELVGTYGNAVHRVLTFVQRHFDARAPQPGRLTAADAAMLDRVQSAFAATAQAIEHVRLRDALAEALAVARAANRYLDEQAPWKAIKSDRERAAATVYTMLQVLNGLKFLFAPILPFSSQQLHTLLGFQGDVMSSRWEPQLVPAGQSLPVPSPLFAKFDPPSDGDEPQA